jgi:predicted nucleic acid-binding protein
MIVADANMIAYLFLTTDKTSLAEQVWAKDSEWFVPFLWRSEVLNILTNYMRHNLLTLEQTQEIMERAHVFLSEHEYFVSSDQVLALTASSRCTAYDCEYVALAQQYDLPLVTFDKEVVRNFPEVAKFPQDYLVD